LEYLQRESPMTSSNYEFQYVSKRQRLNLVLCKLFVIFWILAFLALMIFKSIPDTQNDLLFASGIMNAIFAYINLMRVKVEVQEIFEPPVKWHAMEFFWLGLIFCVTSFLV
jgi:hypothetical protein